MMLHLDIQVDDLEEAGAHAQSAGAVLAEYQPQVDVRVYLDPAGHPFCHDPSEPLTYTVMCNTSEGAWPIVRRLSELLSP